MGVVVVVVAQLSTTYGGWKAVQHKRKGQAIAKKYSAAPHKQDGCTNLNWYSTPANSNFHVYFDR